jgi:outer membrane immunogenic protein
MSKSALYAAISASALFVALSAAQAADMPVKAVPLPPSFSWAGAYVGLNGGGSLDRLDVGQVNLTSPGFVFSDPNGAFAGFPTQFFGFPGAFQVAPTNQSRGGGSFIGGGQIGYNLQSGNIVYGVEGDVQVMRNRDTLSAALLEFTPGVIPAGNVTRNTFATFSIERQWQATVRGRFGYAWDRLLVYATGGLAVTSLKTGTNYTYQTIIGPALTGFIAPPVNLSAPGVGSSHEYYGVTFGGGFEYALWGNWSLGAEYRAADFGKQNITIGVAPPGGLLLPTGTPVETSVRLISHQATARLNYRFAGPEMASKSVALPGTAGSNWSGCYAGGYAGAAWGRDSVDTFDPSAKVASVFGPPPFVQTPFYSTGAGLSAAPAPYSYNLGASGMGGGTLGCNFQAASSRIVWGLEAEAGVLRLTATVQNPYTTAFGLNDTTDSTTVGNWYGAVAGRLGYSVADMLFYLKGGVGFTHVAAESLDLCITGTGGCGSQALFARGSANPVFFVAGGGAEWAFLQNWSVKAEYLFLGIDQNFAACGPGGGRLFLPNLTFCANHHVGGLHTAKIGVNYKFF